MAATAGTRAGVHGDRARVLWTADSVLRARGGDPTRWTRLTTIGTDTLEEWPRFLRQNKIVRERSRSRPPTCANVVGGALRPHGGNAADRIEEWRIRLWPDGRQLDARLYTGRGAWRRRGQRGDSAHRRRGLVRERVDLDATRDRVPRDCASGETRRHRHIHDTAVKLPAGGSGGVWVDIAGDQPLLVRRGVELPEVFLRADRARETN